MADNIGNSADDLENKARDAGMESDGRGMVDELQDKAKGLLGKIKDVVDVNKKA